MSGGKAAKRSTSGATANKTTFLDETNHAAVSLTPKEDDSSRWVSTLSAPLTLLKAASKHAAKLNENRMLYNVSDATKAAMVTPTTVNSGLQMGGDNVYNMEGLLGVDTSDVRKTDFDARARPCRGVGSILANSRGARKKAKPTRRRAPGDGVIEHLQHTYIHHHTHARTHTGNQRNTCPRACCNCIL